MTTLLWFTGLLIAALLIEPLATRLRLPFSAALVIVGFIGSECVVALGFDTGLRWHHFSELILEVLLPVLVFESAFNLRTRDVLKNIIPILYLAIPVMVIATFITGGIIYLGIGSATGFPWVVALLTGALLSATDPVAVVALFKKAGAPHQLHIMLEGESLFNDATAIVLFSLLLALTLMPASEITLSGAILEFLRTFTGGILAGVVIGALGMLLMTAFKSAVPRGIATVAGGIVSFYVAEHVLHVSGVMAVLCSGLMMGEINRRRGDAAFPCTLWEFNAYIANALIFLLLGVTITLDMFSERWLAMLIGIAAVLMARILAVYVLLPAIQPLPGVAPVPLVHRSVMLWGGLRGAVTVALALSLPLELEAWYTVQSIAYGVVLFTLFIQAPTMGLLLKHLGLAGFSERARPA